METVLGESVSRQMDERISVIIPVYNAAPYLQTCLDSVLGQTFQNIEIVIVDDGSTDRSGELADSYAERHPDRIKLLRQENQGVTAARINGIKAAAGDWIGFVDADDEIEPDMYERLLKNALKYDADISHCGHQTIVNGGERIHYFYNTGRLTVQDRESALKELLIGEFEPGLWTKIYKRDIVQAVLKENVIDQTIKFHEDLLMNYYLFSQAENTVFEDFCGYHYMAQPTSATRNSFRIEKAIDPVRVGKTILENSGQKLKNAAWRNYLSCCLHGYISIYDHREYRQEADELKTVLLDNLDKRKLLTRNERIKLMGMLTSPALFKKLYRFYEKRFQKKLFE